MVDVAGRGIVLVAGHGKTDDGRPLIHACLVHVLATSADVSCSLECHLSSIMHIVLSPNNRYSPQQDMSG